MFYNKEKLYDEYIKLSKTTEFLKFVENRDSLPVKDYININWENATEFDAIKFALPRLSEIGGLYAEEIFLIYKICKELQPKLIIETGRMYGTSTRLFGIIAKLFNGKIISIDGELLTHVTHTLDELNLSSYVELMVCWSPWLSKIPNWQNVNLLFIDGDHSFTGALVDYHYFNYFIPKDGIILFHDNNIEGVKKAMEVAKNRDNLQLIGEMGRLTAFQKTTDKYEKYFQIIDRGVQQ